MKIIENPTQTPLIVSRLSKNRAFKTTSIHLGVAFSIPRTPLAIWPQQPIFPPGVPRLLIRLPTSLPVSPPNLLDGAPPLPSRVLGRAPGQRTSVTRSSCLAVLPRSTPASSCAWPCRWASLQAALPEAPYRRPRSNPAGGAAQSSLQAALL